MGTRIYFPADWADEDGTVTLGDGVVVDGLDLSGATVAFTPDDVLDVADVRFVDGLRVVVDAPGTKCAVVAGEGDEPPTVEVSVPQEEGTETVRDPLTCLTVVRRRPATRTETVDAYALFEAIQDALRSVRAASAVPVVDYELVPATE